jgi:hypothetical protein
MFTIAKKNIFNKKFLPSGIESFEQKILPPSYLFLPFPAALKYFEEIRENSRKANGGKNAI